MISNHTKDNYFLQNYKPGEDTEYFSIAVPILIISHLYPRFNGVEWNINIEQINESKQ